MTISQATSSSTATTTSTSDVLMTGMTLTPGAGNFLAVASINIRHQTSGQRLYLSIYDNGSQVSGSEREFYNESSMAGTEFVYMTHALVSPGAGNDVEVRWRVDGGTGEAQVRSLVLLPYTGDGVSATSTSQDTEGGETDNVLQGMQLSFGLTSGKTYLVMFSAYAYGTPQWHGEFSVYNGGSRVSDSPRRTGNEQSIGSTSLCVATATVVEYSSGTIEIQWKNTTAGETGQCFDRIVTAVEVATGDVATALSSTPSTGNTDTSDTVMSGMTVTDPGADDWLAIGTGWGGYSGAVTGTNNVLSCNLYNAGTKVTDSERDEEWDTSIDSWPYWTFLMLAMKVTVSGSTDDVDIRWRGDDSDAREVNERGLILVRETTGGATYDNSLSLARTAALSLSGIIVAGGSLTLARVLTTTLSGVLNTDDSLTLARGHGVTLSERAQVALALARTAAVAQSGLLGTDDSLALNRVMAAVLSGLMATDDSLSLARSAGLTLNESAQVALSLARTAALALGGIVSKEVSLSLNRVMAASLSGLLSTDDSLSLSRSAGIGLSETAQNTLALARTMAVAQSGLLSTNGSLALARSAAATLSGLLTTDDSLALARTLAITLNSLITKEANLSLSRLAAISTSGLLVTDDSLALSRSAGISSSGVIVFDRSLSLARSSALSLSGLLVTDDSLALARTLAIVLNSEILAGVIEVSLSLARSHSLSAGGSADFTAALALARQLGISQAAALEAMASTDLARQLGITESGLVAVERSLSLARAQGLTLESSLGAVLEATLLLSAILTIATGASVPPAERRFTVDDTGRTLTVDEIARIFEVDDTSRTHNVEA